MTPDKILDQMAATFRERNSIYGNNYINFGHIMLGLFPNGLTIKTPQEWIRLGLFVQIMSKNTRYAENFVKGHLDSIHDLGVYAAILESFDRACQE